MSPVSRYRTPLRSPRMSLKVGRSRSEKRAGRRRAEYYLIHSFQRLPSPERARLESYADRSSGQQSFTCSTGFGLLLSTCRCVPPLRFDCNCSFWLNRADLKRVYGLGWHV